MEDRDGWIWYDGQLIAWRSAKVHVLTHSLHYGLSVFEGVRVYETPLGPALFRVSEHTTRLLGSAHVYGMTLPFTHAELVAAQVEAVRANALRAGYVRTIAFLGAEKVGVSPIGAQVHVAVAAFPWQNYLGKDASNQGIRVKTSSFVRAPSNACPPRAKIAANYANSILAHQEAVADGYDEALLLDVRGLVAEGAGENLFVVQSGQLLEPGGTSALAGITRDSLIELAKSMGLSVQPRDLTRDDVYLCEEAFFCGTAAELVPIVELDRRRIGSGRPGPITQALMARFRSLTSGLDEHASTWLTPVAASPPLS